jgi:hypothetical protein
MADSRLENLICRKADRVVNRFSFQELVHARLREGGITSKGDACRRPSVACDHRLENRFPIVGAVDVAGAKRASLQIAILIEDEERMVAGAAEVPVPSATFLIAMRRAYARIHIKHDACGRAALRNLVDPMTGEIAESCEVFRSCQPVRFEPSHLAWRCARTFRCFATDDPAHGGIVSQAQRVVHVFVSRKSAEDRLTEHADECVATVLPRARIGEKVTGR